MNSFLKIICIGLLFIGLISVRWFQEELFYDPLILFFRTNFSVSALPEIEVLKLLLHTTFRFAINTVLSLAILWFWFQKKGVIKVSAIIYIMLFFVLIVLFYWALQNDTVKSHLFLFYVRRFLIQPILLLLLIPAFYFQSLKS